MAVQSMIRGKKATVITDTSQAFVSSASIPIEQMIKTANSSFDCIVNSVINKSWLAGH